MFIAGKKLMMRNTNWEGYRKLAWAGVVLLALTLVIVVMQANWIGTAFLTGFLVLSVAFLQLEQRLPTLFDLVFVSAALLNAIGCAWDLYNQPGLYDEVAHFSSIFALTLAAGFALYRELMGSYKGHRLLFVVTIASLGIAIGALWEVAEWTADFFVEQQIVSGLFDTITDLILDSAGALVAAMLNLWGLNELSRAEQVARAQEHDDVLNGSARLPEASSERG
jgi:hypothetical protein